MFSLRRLTHRWPAALAAAGLLLTQAWAAAPRPSPKAVTPPKRILILGGTGFLGPTIVEAALARGHQVTLFNRGRTRPGLFPTVEHLQGDRDPLKGEGLKALEGRTWDAVVDTSGYYPRIVKASADLLAGKVKQYIYISSISAYKEPNPVGGDESAPLATMPDPALENMGKEYEFYGALKALCEQAAEKAMPGHAVIVRPGFIVGPDDASGRFAYWPVRADRGGDILAPGTPKDPVQFIDVRDLGAWLVKLVEDGTLGTFTATGPRERLAWGDFLKACTDATSARSRLVWVPNAFLAKQENADFPIWAPAEGKYEGFATWSNARAVKAGLTFRPMTETVRDTLAWYKTQVGLEKGRNKLAGPTAGQEAVLLKAWAAASAPAPAPSPAPAPALP